ncbi:hypothetical protein DID78_04620 [Candidatus Marinamargulisbacteria bacterium SCGC AG-343-D04]|nr:hypothetical protein DID78_04620 [Candidatus Marinamargulisbacteria bacterium SCGC AG-343-D04]
MIRRIRKHQGFSLELAPIIDIVFILLIFFAVSSSLISKNEGIPVELPQAASATQNDDGVTITVTQDKRIFIDRKEIKNSELPSYIKGLILENERYPIIFNAHQSLDYATVIDLLDTIRIAGGANLALQVEKVILQ